jgi:restriction endonuclease Mrr
VWKFSGSIQCTCSNCGDSAEVPIDDFNIDNSGGSERQMGSESIYEISYEFDCIKCSQPISLNFEATEYPVECLNFVKNNSSGALTIGEPEFEHLPEIYCAEDILRAYESIQELVSALKIRPYLLRKLTSREFEEVVAEVFRAKGFAVDLTKKTCDGGKDIIAIHTDGLGIQSKYFIECKHHAEDNKIGVGIVRALHGVKNTKDGPNKTILATTSTFTSDAKKFVDNEIASKWDLTLADYDEIVRWLADYKES